MDKEKIKSVNDYFLLNEKGEVVAVHLLLKEYLRLKKKAGEEIQFDRPESSIAKLIEQEIQANEKRIKRNRNRNSQRKKKRRALSQNESDIMTEAKVLDKTQTTEDITLEEARRFEERYADANAPRPHQDEVPRTGSRRDQRRYRSGF